VSTVTYNYPTAAASTVAPTTIQAVVARVNAQVVFGDADTTAVVTHNFLLSTAETNAGQPDVIIVPLGAGTNPSTLTVALTNSIAITFTKGTATGSAQTVAVTILRPHSLIR
jgi:hypothetical protein